MKTTKSYSNWNIFISIPTWNGIKLWINNFRARNGLYRIKPRKLITLEQAHKLATAPKISNLRKK